MISKNLDAVVLEDRKPQPVFRATVRIDELAERHGESLRELWRSMQTRGVTAAGPPFVGYHIWGQTETEVEVGHSVADAVSGEGRITAGELPGGAAISTDNRPKTDLESGLGAALAGSNPASSAIPTRGNAPHSDSCPAHRGINAQSDR